MTGDEISALVHSMNGAKLNERRRIGRRIIAAIDSLYRITDEDVDSAGRAAVGRDAFDNATESTKAGMRDEMRRVLTDFVSRRMLSEQSSSHLNTEKP